MQRVRKEFFIPLPPAEPSVHCTKQTVRISHQNKITVNLYTPAPYALFSVFFSLLLFATYLRIYSSVRVQHLETHVQIQVVKIKEKEKKKLCILIIWSSSLINLFSSPNQLRLVRFLVWTCSCQLVHLIQFKLMRCHPPTSLDSCNQSCMQFQLQKITALMFDFIAIPTATVKVLKG